MKNVMHNFNKVFESRIRLGIMSALAVNDQLDFSALKEFLNVTDGNLASHIKALEKEGYLGIKKTFINRKPNTKYSMTMAGKTAFELHLACLEELLKKQH